MVPDADAVISIARDQGMLAALAPGAIWVQMSTIGLGGINDVMAMVDHERPDVVLLDAPVSGSKDPAEQGQLIIFASGPEDARSRVTPLFDALGHRTIWVGAAGPLLGDNEPGEQNNARRQGADRLKARPTA